MGNWLISLVGFFVCAFFGKSISNKYAESLETLKYVENFNKNLIVNVKFQRKNLVEFINEYDKNNLILKSYLKQTSAKSIKFDFIKDKKIKENLQNYFSTIGKSDWESQLNFLSGYEVIFEELIKEYKQEFNKKIKLYPKLGVLGGLIVFIMLI